jgi:hypothetical protein
VLGAHDERGPRSGLRRVQQKSTDSQYSRRSTEGIVKTMTSNSGHQIRPFKSPTECLMDELRHRHTSADCLDFDYLVKFLVDANLLHHRVGVLIRDVRPILIDGVEKKSVV